MDDDHVGVVDLDIRLRVVLIGPGLVCAHGLAAAGMFCSSATGPVSAVSQFHHEIPLVLVVPQEQVAALLVVQCGPPDPVVDDRDVDTQLAGVMVGEDPGPGRAGGDLAQPSDAGICPGTAGSRPPRAPSLALMF